jgi:hypothetical protein
MCYFAYWRTEIKIFRQIDKIQGRKFSGAWNENLSRSLEWVAYNESY